MPLAFVGLGANLGDPPAQLASALSHLQALPGCQLRASSGFYRSAALRMPGDDKPQPDYCNAVAALGCDLTATELLQALLRIESVHGRDRAQNRRWQSRSLDLDLLMFGAQRLQQPGLEIPHAQLKNRQFVLQPWCDIAPQLEVPGLGTLLSLKQSLNQPALPLWGLVNPLS